MKYQLQDLIDIEHFQDLQDRLNKIYPFPSSIIDNDGNILTATAWQDICVYFHRKNKESERICIESDQYIKEHLAEANPALSYRCPHGLVDNAMPIIIQGNHYGNFFTGQFFLEKPDLDFFRSQAVKYGFDEDAYLEAVKKVPIWNKEQLNNYLSFIRGLIEVISQSGLQRLKEIENRKLIQKSEERYRSIIRAALDGYWRTSVDGRLLEVNESYCTMSGYSESELLSMHISDLEAVESSLETAHHMRKVVLEGSDRFETKHLRKDGSLFDVEVSIQYRPDEDGQCVCFLRDISESKAAGEELRKQKERQAAIIEGANVGTWEWNVQTGECIFNERWADIIGYKLEELAPLSVNTWIERVHPDDLNVSNEKLEHHFRGELEYYDCECRMKHREGHWVWVLDRGKVISRTDGGEPLWMFGTHTDITELKRAEEEQARLQAQLAQAQKMDALGTLSSGIAHDFNNILAAILGYSELALDDLPQENYPVAQDLAEISRAAMKAKQLVRQILTFSRVAEGQRRPLSVGRVAQEARAILERTLPKMIDLRLEIQEDLWTVTADPQQLEQVFINLATNAADAIEGKGIVTFGASNLEPDRKVCQSCGQELAGRQVLITVEDDGQRISPEILTKIFEPFFTTKGVGKGTGLGLSTVYGIVTGHGGHVCCKSKEEEGTTFFIHLPADSQKDIEPETKKGDAPESLEGSGMILVVDDERTVRDIAQKRLSRNGYEVIQAASGEEALTIYKERKHEIDLVLMDLGMPGMGGKACLKEIRRIDPDARVLIASGYIQYELTDELESLGALGMVAKPYSKPEILKAIKDALS